MEISVGELGDDLKRYLADAGGGVTITVTDGGKAIARITPALTRLQQMIADGEVQPPQRPKRPAGISIKADGIVSDLIRGCGSCGR